MRTYYVKENGNYVPVGCDVEMSSPGVWLVEMKLYGKSCRWLVKNIMDLPDPLELKILTQTRLLEDALCKALERAWRNGRASSEAEWARLVAEELTKRELKLHNVPKADKRKTLSARELRG